MAGVEAYNDMPIVIWPKVNRSYMDIMMLYVSILSEPSSAIFQSKALHHRLVSEMRLSLVSLPLEPLVSVQKANKWEGILCVL